MERKEILLDLTLANKNCGFGEIATTYAKIFSSLEIPDMHFNFLVKKKLVGAFGDKVGYLKHLSIYKHIPYLIPHRYDLWHCIHQYYADCPNYARTKRLLTVHDLNGYYEMEGKERKKFMKKIQKRIDNADYITTISNFSMEEMRKFDLLKGKPAQVIRNAVRDTSGDERTKPSFVTEGKKFLFSIGEVKEKKNISLLLDVIKFLPEYELYICGRTKGDFGEAMMRRVKNENITNAHITGEITEAEKNWMFANMDALMFPSKFEGFGLPVIEAMHFGRAVFSSAYTCLPETCGGHAFVWEDMSPRAMAEFVRAKLPEFYASDTMAKEAKEYAMQFSYKNHIEEYIRLYRKILGMKDIEINF